MELGEECGQLGMVHRRTKAEKGKVIILPKLPIIREMNSSSISAKRNSHLQLSKSPEIHHGSPQYQ